MNLPLKVSQHNFKSFIWHAVFLAFAQNFMDVDTVIPAMVIESGGTALHIGIITAIMMGGASFAQLFFAPFVNNVKYKKTHLLIGINFRIFSLFALAFTLYLSYKYSSNYILIMLFLFISVFSFSGAYSNISYADVLGKSINQDKRKSFFSLKQIAGGVIVIGTAFLVKLILNKFQFPKNYAWMFLIGGVALLIASFGFWSIKEIKPSGAKISGIKNFIKRMITEIKENKKLLYFLGFINTQGIVISFIPFVMLYAKETFGTQSTHTGIFLIYKVIGVVAISFFVLLLNKTIKYNKMLYANVFLTLLLATGVMFIPNLELLKYLFIIGGFSVSIYTIAMNGILLEISKDENRALYAGFAGGGNILPMLFPLISTFIIGHLGYTVFFALFMTIVSLSIYFIYKIKCIA